MTIYLSLSALICLYLFQPQILPAQTQRSPFEAVPEAPLPVPVKMAGPTIEEIEFRGASRLPQSTLRALTFSRVGGPGDIETLRRDSQALYSTGRFSDVALETAPGSTGVIVRFVVVERPLIEAFEYLGDDTVTMAEILERFKDRKIRLRAETLYHQDELGLAAATVQELVSEKGRRNISITASVEPASLPSTVKVVFRVEQKQ